MRVLVAEDDEGVRSVLARGLREHGYVVDAVDDGSSALAYFRAYQYDVAVIDWRMPKVSGMDVIEQLRKRGDRTPILMLTARDATEDRVTGLHRGADDYLIKPFSFAELLARLSALQRRPPLTLDPIIRCGDVAFDPSTLEFTRNTEPLPLTIIESALLELLMRRSPAVVSRRSIALHVWEDEADAVGSNTIDVHIARLRTKMGDSAARIETVRGTGYRLVTS